MRAILLGYHSHHIVGDDYARNDHRAFAGDLELITDAGYRVVPLRRIIDRLVRGASPDAREGDRFVALTFDDGPVWDVEDFVHPVLGPQRSFLNSMRNFRERFGIGAQPDLHATSFVIASPVARAVIETSFDRDYTWLAPGTMGDGWWNDAVDTGLVAIANHSWDHLHPALERVAHSEQVRADFARVESFPDADAQILDAQAFIAEKTGGRAEPIFAYPFGQYNRFLVDSYFPARRHHGFLGAVTTDPGAVDVAAGPWRLARYVCGDHWRSPEELAAILR